jgi:hypothetical protein
MCLWVRAMAPQDYVDHEPAYVGQTSRVVVAASAAKGPLLTPFPWGCMPVLGMVYAPAASPPTPLQCGCPALQLLMMAHAPQSLPLPLQWVFRRVELAVDAQPSPPTPLQCSCPAL